MPRFLGRMLRRVVPCLAVVAAWAAWWLWPASPLREHQFEQVSMWPPQIAGGGRTVVLFAHSNQPFTDPSPNQRANCQYERVRLVNLETGEDLLADEPAQFGALLSGGERLAVGFRDGRLDVFEASSGRREFTVPTQGAHRLPRIKVSPDGHTIAVSGSDDAVEVWNARAGRCLLTAQAQEWELSHDGRLFVWRDADRWGVTDTTDGRPIVQSSDPLVLTAAARAVRPDGAEMAICVPTARKREFRIAILNLPDLSQRASIDVDTFSDRPSVEYSPAGRYLVTGGVFQGSLWDPSGSKPKPLDNWGSRTWPFHVVGPADRSYILFSQVGLHKWAIYNDAFAPPVIEGERSTSIAPMFSPTGRRLIIAQYPRAIEPAWLRAVMERVGALKLVEGRGQFSVFDLERGTLVNRFAGPSGELGFGPGDETFWTVEGVQDPATQKVRSSACQWAAIAAWPPWWLWVVTVTGLGLAVWPPRRAEPTIARGRHVSPDPGMTASASLT